MPEIIEVEMYRKLAERVTRRRVVAVEAPDPWYLKGGLDPSTVAGIVGSRVAGARRLGKLLMLDVGGNTEVTLGLRFGMSGRLVVDGDGVIDELLYTTTQPDPAYMRFGIGFDGGGSLEMFDPRRLGGVEWNPDEQRLGVDAMVVTAEAMASVLRRGRGPLKARLLDQSRVAGIGNLICDETLWRVGLSPLRPAGELTSTEIPELAAAVRSTIADLLSRGGSHTGDLQEERSTSGHCPSDGAELRRDKVGGRTTYWCPLHQR